MAAEWMAAGQMAIGASDAAAPGLGGTPVAMFVRERLPGYAACARAIVELFPDLRPSDDAIAEPLHGGGGWEVLYEVAPRAPGSHARGGLARCEVRKNGTAVTIVADPF